MTCSDLCTISRETFSPVDSAPAAPEEFFHPLLLTQPGPSSPRVLVTTAWPWPCAAAGAALGSAGIFSSAHDIARVHGVTYFGKAELSPHCIPTCWEDAAGPRNSPPGHPVPSTWCLAPHGPPQNPGADCGEEEEGPVGAKAACSRDMCRAPRWVLLCRDSTVFWLGSAFPHFPCLR